MDCIVHGVAKSQTQLSDFHFHQYSGKLEKKSPYLAKIIKWCLLSPWGFPVGSDSKPSACNVRDPGLTPGSGRFPRVGMATHSSILAWRTPRTKVTAHELSKSQTQLSD